MRNKTICFIVISALAFMYAGVTTVTAQEADGENGFIEIERDEGEIKGAQAIVTDTNKNLISITLEDVGMEQVVSMFTKVSGANIIATPSNLLGQVTVSLTDVEWKPALESILKMHNLAMEESRPGSGVYSIVSRSPDAPEPLIVETVFLKYATVSAVSDVIKSMLAGGGTVSSFPSRNALIIRSTAANLGEIQKVLEVIDIMRDQVFIEAKFMELNDSAIKDLGINWQALSSFSIGASGLLWGMSEERTWTDNRTDSMSQWDTRAQTQAEHRYVDAAGLPAGHQPVAALKGPLGFGGLALDESLTEGQSVQNSIDRGKDITTEITSAFDKTISDARTAILDIKDFRLVLSALKKMSGVTIVSNPKIIVANEESAIIHIGETERPFISSVTPGQQGIAPIVTYNPGDPVKLGVELTVTPTVNTKSNITIRIEPKLTRFVRNAVAPNGQTYPIIATKEIKTVFALESGKTVAIGGLTETTDRDVTTKIPLLGDIPLIGKYLFSHTSKERTQRETIIFVTVSLAVPDTIQRLDGLPENTELTQRHLIRSKAKRRKSQDEVERLREAAEAESVKRAEKVRSRLLRRRK